MLGKGRRPDLQVKCHGEVFRLHFWVEATTRLTRYDRHLVAKMQCAESQENIVEASCLA